MKTKYTNSNGPFSTKKTQTVRKSNGMFWPGSLFPAARSFIPTATEMKSRRSTPKFQRCKWKTEPFQPASAETLQPCEACGRISLTGCFITWAEPTEMWTMPPHKLRATGKGKTESLTAGGKRPPAGEIGRAHV